MTENERAKVSSPFEQITMISTKKIRKRKYNMKQYVKETTTCIKKYVNKKNITEFRNDLNSLFKRWDKFFSGVKLIDKNYEIKGLEKLSFRQLSVIYSHIPHNYKEPYNPESIKWFSKYKK